MRRTVGPVPCSSLEAPSMAIAEPFLYPRTSLRIDSLPDVPTVARTALPQWRTVQRPAFTDARATPTLGAFPVPMTIFGVDDARHRRCPVHHCPVRAQTTRRSGSD